MNFYYECTLIYMAILCKGPYDIIYTYIWITFLTSMFVCPSVRLFVRPFVRVCVRKLALSHAVLWQNVTNKSCLVCVQSEKYASWVNLTPQLDRCCRGEAEVRILDFKTTWSEFQIPSQNTLAEAKPKYMFRVSSPPQSRSKAVVCVSTPRMYPRSGYFLVIFNL